MKKYVVLMVLAIMACILAWGYADQASKPPLPISIGFRRALMGPGLVAQFRNNSNEMIEVRASFRSTDIGTAQSFDLILSPNQIREIGWAEGWSVVPGQRIDLMNNRFRSAEVIVGGGTRNQ